MLITYSAKEEVLRSYQLPLKDLGNQLQVPETVYRVKRIKLLDLSFLPVLPLVSEQLTSKCLLKLVKQRLTKRIGVPHLQP